MLNFLYLLKLKKSLTQKQRLGRGFIKPGCLLKNAPPCQPPKNFLTTPATCSAFRRRVASFPLRPISVCTLTWQSWHSAHRFLGSYMSRYFSAQFMPISTGLRWCTSVAGVIYPSAWQLSHSGCAVSISRRRRNHRCVCISFM